MKIMSRDFTFKEKILLLILAIILVGICYYMFILSPSMETISKAETEKESLLDELTIVSANVTALENKQEELENIKNSGNSSVMPSYNNQKAENDELNTAFEGLHNYSVSFSSVTRSGDQIRRDFSFSFTADSYDEVQDILEYIANNDNRCLISNCNIGISRSNTNKVTSYSVSGTATFYETMVGGTADAGLPVEKAAAVEE